MSIESHLQEAAVRDAGDAYIPANGAAARTAAADAQAAAGQRLRAPEIPAQLSGDRADSELADEAPAAAVNPGNVMTDGAEATGAPDVVVEGTVVDDGPVKAALETPRDQPEVATEEDRPHGPYYDWLQRQGEAGRALEPYLQRLTLTKENYADLARVRRGEPGDDLDKGLLDRLGDGRDASLNVEVGQLTDILCHSVKEVQEHPELVQDGSVNWLGLGTSLAERASALGKDPADARYRRELLTSAATAALMSENPDDRITFLERTDALGMRHHVAHALSHSDVSIVLGGYRNADIQLGVQKNARADRSIQGLSRFSFAFQAAGEDVARYRQIVERDLGEPADAHTAMKDMMADYGTHDDVVNGGHGEALEASSVAAPYVDRYRVDPTRAERYALQEMYVQAQMDRVFPGGKTDGFRLMLGAQRPTDGDMYRLVMDTRAALALFSKPVTSEFTVPAGEPNETWSREQLAAWRYKELAAKARVYDSIQKFVDPTIYGKSSNFQGEISDISKDGAALPGITSEAITNVLELARAYTKETGDQVSPAELRDLMQANRRQLMKVAAMQIDNFSATIVRGNSGGAQTFGQRPYATGAAEIVRGPDGRLQLKGPLFQPEKASSLAAARLACVALRVNIEEPPAEGAADSTPTKTNSIDLLSEIFIDEAYERGIFAQQLTPVAA